MTALLEQLKNEGQLFNVLAEPIYTADGTKIHGKRVLRNEDTGEVISVVNKSYKVVTNTEVFTSFSESLERSGLDLTDMKVKVNSTANNARTMVDIIFPAHTIETKVGDITQLRITTLNSFDGSWRFMSRAGGMRLACLNGQVIFNEIGNYSSKHVAGFDVEKSAEHIVHILQSFNEAKDHWRTMMTTKVQDHEFYLVVDKFLGGNGQIPDLPAFLKRKPVEELNALYIKYSKEMGNTAWAVYNAFTDYVTHKKYNDDSAATSLNHNEMKLAQLISSSHIFH